MKGSVSHGATSTTTSSPHYQMFCFDFSSFFLVLFSSASGLDVIALFSSFFSSSSFPFHFNEMNGIIIGSKCDFEFCYDCGADHKEIIKRDNSVHSPFCRWHPDNLSD